jgi:branched-chain amino acid transport system substrate-binding protein
MASLTGARRLLALAGSLVAIVTGSGSAVATELVAVAEHAEPAYACAASPAGPIVVGDVSTLSGRFHFPQSGQAAAAVFAAANAQCGAHGRRIEYELLDDGADPEKAVGLVRSLVDERGAVALVGGTSAVSCNANAELFASHAIAAIPGVGTTPRCFDSPDIAPSNTGVFSITTLALKFAARYLSPRKLCLVGNAHPNIPGNFQEPVERFHEITGVTATIVNQELRIDDDPSQALAQLQAAGCDVAFVGTLAEFGARLAQAMARLPDHRLKIVLAPEAYTSAFASQLDPALEGRVFATTDMDFLDSRKPAMAQIRARLQSAGVELSPFAVGGDLSAQIIVDVLRHMNGAIDRHTVLAALLAMKPYNTRSVTAFPYVFAGPAEHRAAPAIHVVVLKQNAWAHATEEWITLRSK